MSRLRDLMHNYTESDMTTEQLDEIDLLALIIEDYEERIYPIE